MPRSTESHIEPAKRRFRATLENAALESVARKTRSSQKLER
jgi:hypothetical protein